MRFVVVLVDSKYYYALVWKQKITNYKCLEIANMRLEERILICHTPPLHFFLGPQELLLSLKIVSFLVL